MDLLSPEPGLIFWTIVTFVILLLILRKTAWGPVLRGLEDREKRIKDSLDNADAARQETEKLLEEQKKLLSEARGESQKILENAQKAAETSKQEILQQAKAEAKQTLDAAKEEIELSRDKALKDIRQLTADVAVAVASKLISKSLDAEDHSKLIADSVKEFDRLS